MECETPAQLGPLEHGLALAVVDDGKLDFLEHVLVVSIDESVLAPAGHEAATSGEVFLAVGQADGADVRADERKRLSGN